MPNHIRSTNQRQEMRTLYLSVLLMNVADSLLSIFVPIFFYQLGYTIPRILFFIG